MLTIPKWILKFIGNIHISKTPLWISYKPEYHKITGSEIRNVLDKLQLGDILLNRHDGYLSTIVTPGIWAHAALYVGNNKVIHSIGSGVQEDDILHFCRCDSIAVLRIPHINVSEVSNIVKKAAAMKNNHVKYDFDFRKGNDTYYCTEFIDVCMDDLFENDYKMKFGRMALTPDNMFDSDELNKILVIRH